MTGRVVHEGCALEWLREHALPPDAAILTSLPNFDEFGHRDPLRWRAWFLDAAQLVLRSAARARACVFFQTDVKHDGAWIDKSFLLQLAGERAEARLLWHKIALRAPAGTRTNQRPGYGHLLCFSNVVSNDAANATPDVLERLGEQTWPRGMGADVAGASVRWLAEHAQASTIIAPFCGEGAALDAATARGLAAVGIERNPGRARRAAGDHS
ncbi:MAG: SAM-dependent methyltransferase [Planctomycetota bacterium]|nr:SAM-dependent methyltransferase [Planctomycetota bacterium]